MGFNLFRPSTWHPSMAWMADFSVGGFVEDVKEDTVKIPKIVGDTVKGVVAPILSGARKALTPTLIWLVVFTVIALILFFSFKKAVRA